MTGFLKNLFKNFLIYLYVILTVPPMGLLACLIRKKVLAWLWCEGLLRFAGIRIRILGKGLPPFGQYIFMSNHQSQLDIPVLESLLRDYDIRFLAKQSLFKIPFFGWGLSALGYFPVEREDPKEGLKSILACVEALKKGISLVIFPEGTRSKTGELLPFKKGGMLIPLKAQVAVCPIAIWGTKDLLPKGSLRFFFPKGKAWVYVYVGEIIKTKGLNLRDKESLLQRVREEISLGLETCKKFKEEEERLWERSWR